MSHVEAQAQNRVVPWYRAHDYKGDMTETEKRELDAFRMEPKHPATQFDDLPEEVQSYITIIGGELYDLKQGRAAGQALLVSALGAATLFLNYKGCLGTPSIWSYAGSVLLLVVPWFFYRYQWNKNAEEYMPSEAPWRATEEAIRQEWELNYLADSRRTVMQRPMVK